MRGVIRTIPTGKNFGFIRGPDGQDRFFYAGSLSPLTVPFDDLEEGDTVTFEPITAPDGRLRAVTVSLYAKQGDQEMSTPYMEDPHGEQEGDHPPSPRHGDDRNQGD